MRPEHHSLATELVAIFQKSLRDYPSAGDCSTFWQGTGAAGKARRFVDLNAQAAVVFRAGQGRTAVVNDPSLVHLFWLLDVDPIGVRRYVDMLLDKSITRSFPHTKFWAEYSQAIALFSGLPAAMGTKPKLVGYEKFWEPYLDFMAGSISKKEVAVRAGTSFANRNRQSRCIDWQGLDGDAKNPVKWDFRYASLQRKAEPCAPPNGGPAEQLGNSVGIGGPPSAS